MPCIDRIRPISKGVLHIFKGTSRAEKFGLFLAWLFDCHWLARFG
ncbi:hypothetical protein [Moraxella lacunata]